jgi:hypothetical protein
MQHISVVVLDGIEPSFIDYQSIILAIVLQNYRIVVVIDGIDPSSAAYETTVLPLNYITITGYRLFSPKENLEIAESIQNLKSLAPHTGIEPV